MATYGEKKTKDYSPDDFQSYTDAKFGSNQKELADIQQKSQNISDAARISQGLNAQGLSDQQSGFTPATQDNSNQELGQAMSRGMSGGIGTAMLSGGVATMNPALIAGGLAVSAVESDAKAKRAKSEAEAIEAQQRKQAQLSSINNMIAVSKGLNLGV